MSNQTIERQSLEKSMSPLAIWSLAFGAIIGWGAFIMPGIRFLPGSGPLGACIGFAIGGIMLMFVALSYGRLVGVYPVAGGVFAFAYAIFGPTMAFVCGWALVLGYLSIIALNGTAIVLLTRFLLPGVLEFGHMYTIAGWNVYFGELLVLETFLVLFWFLNYRGADVVSKVQVLLALILAAGVVILVAGAFIAPTAEFANLEPLFAPDKSAIASIAVVVAIAPWLFVGFDTIPQAAEEFNFPPAMGTALMVLAIVCGIVGYAVVTLAVGIVIPYPELIHNQAIIWHTGYTTNLVFGPIGSVPLALAVLAAIFTGINGFYIAGSRLLFSMGRARILPSWFGHLHNRHRTPTNALNFILVLVLIAPFFGREVLSWVVDMSSVGTIIGYFFASLSSYMMVDICRGSLPPSVKTLGILGCGSSLLCLLLLLVPFSPASISVYSWIVLGVWTLLGVCVYFMRLRDVKSFPESERSYLILGDTDMRTVCVARWCRGEA